MKYPCVHGVTNFCRICEDNMTTPSQPTELDKAIEELKHGLSVLKAAEYGSGNFYTSDINTLLLAFEELSLSHANLGVLIQQNESIRNEQRNELLLAAKRLKGMEEQNAILHEQLSKYE